MARINENCYYKNVNNIILVFFSDRLIVIEIIIGTYFYINIGHSNSIADYNVILLVC